MESVHRQLTNFLKIRILDYVDIQVYNQVWDQVRMTLYIQVCNQIRSEICYQVSTTIEELK